MSELKIDSERVLEASKSCPQAKEILQKIFPEVFKLKKKEYVPIDELSAGICRHEAMDSGSDCFHFELIHEHNRVIGYFNANGYQMADSRNLLQSEVADGRGAGIGDQPCIRILKRDDF